MILEGGRERETSIEERAISDCCLLHVPRVGTERATLCARDDALITGPTPQGCRRVSKGATELKREVARGGQSRGARREGWGEGGHLRAEERGLGQGGDTWTSGSWPSELWGAAV